MLRAITLRSLWPRTIYATVSPLGGRTQGGYLMKSTVKKRSVVIAGHKTSLSLEDAFWNEVKMIAAERDMSLSELVSSIELSRQHANLSSALRLFVLDYYRNEAERQPHASRQGGAHPAGRLKAPAM